MTPEQYAKVKDIFQSALDVKTDDRLRFVESKCGDDEFIKNEVILMLEHNLSKFLESTSEESSGREYQEGDKLGRFTIVRRIGKGGMGEVYLARDEALSREVAVKTLLPEFTNNEERVKRFKLEARAASALNHPNIITIHEVGEDNGQLFIATEYIRGETLRGLIEQGRIDIPRGIQIAEQIAAALTAAHQAGVVHRDIKPENVMIREDGLVRVLDFGLAKPLIRDPEAETVELIETKQGMIMGSVAYMSPEQARGKEVDPRTDLWSLGVVLYEILTGQPPFKGETMTDILANIIHKNPQPIVEVIGEIPVELVRIIKKTLKKEKDERYQNARDLVLDLKNLRRDLEIEEELELSVSADRRPVVRTRSNEVVPTGDKETSTNDIDQHTAPVEKSIKPLMWPIYLTLVLTILVLSAGGYVSYQYFRTKSTFESVFNKTTIEKIEIKGKVQIAELSPDKRYLAYVEGSNDTGNRLVLKQMETGAEKEIIPIGDVIVNAVQFSPDGNYFFFHRETLDDEIATGIFRVPLLGGDPEKIATRLDGGFSLDRQGKSLLFTRFFNEEPFRNELIWFDLESKQEKIVLESSDRLLSLATLSPDRKHIAYVSSNSLTSTNATLNWMTVDGREERRLSDIVLREAIEMNWLPDGSGLVLSGEIVGQSNPKIYKIAFPSGDLVPITIDTNRYGTISMSEDSKQLITIQGQQNRGIWEFDLETRTAKQIIANTIDGRSITDVTPDNRFVVFKKDPKGFWSLWLMNLDGTGEKLIAETDDARGIFFVADDGRSCYFDMAKDVWRVDLQTGEKTNLTNTDGDPHFLVGLTYDGKSLLINKWDPSVIRLVDQQSGESKTLLESQTETLVVSSFDRNGSRFTFHRMDDQDPNRAVKTYWADIVDGKAGTPKLLFDEFVTDLFVFSADGNRLYFRDEEKDGGSDLWERDIKSGKVTKITDFNLDRIFNIVPSRDRKKLYLSRGNSTAEVVLIKSVE